ncbi:hypothetical protein CAPTEDRAFT_228414 [Capitella teleta]|uniref:G-protein coupled receptors family 1 profile domain-containing protein n=1 Tax=Capitella teleta TaxID=283909 RepID=R7U5Y3_CAPTE|nr:hypothetical protein CAPTEDRAFT_228414 [Capitella teleta]|eukprot:ELT99106.1 hypothetical protein CAPTEDRAFT_228414 [Capitella teleta]
MASLQTSAFFCVPEAELALEKRFAYALVCMVCSVLGAFGAAHQIRTWRPLVGGFQICRKQSPNPRIILQIAIVDLFTAVGIFVRGLCMVITSTPNYDMDRSAWVPLNGDMAAITIATTVEATCQYCIGVSFTWTVLHAFDTYSQINHKAGIYSWKLCVGAWMLPALSTSASFIAYLGFPGYPTTCPSGWVVALRYALAYSMLPMALLANPVIYCITANIMERQLKETGLISYHHHNFLTAFKLKYVVIVVVFSLCWMPNVMDAILHMVVQGSTTKLTAKSMFFPIWILEAILNPLQGLINCAMYGHHLLLKIQIASNESISNGDPGFSSEDLPSEQTPILIRPHGYGS